MKLRSIAVVAIGFLLVAGCTSSAPAVTPDRSARLDAARHLMTRVRYCALITIGADGQPQARTIDPSPPDERMVIWFATNPATRKRGEIERDPRVTLYYFDERSPGYVTVIGTARITEEAEAKRRWLRKWTPFYPDGAGSAIVYEVTPDRVEVVDVARGIVGDPRSWTPPSVEMRR